MKYFSLLVLLCLTMEGVTQDIHLSQFFNTPLLRNPALAGVFTGDVRLQAVYRNQWQSIGFPYQTNALSGEYKFAVGGGDDFMTVAASAFYDQAGIMKLKTLQVMPAINFHKSLSGYKNSYLSGGFMAGIVNRQFDGQNLTFDNQYTAGRFNPNAASGERFAALSRMFLDVAVGLSFNHDFGENGSYYIGSSLWHFNKPKNGFLNSTISLDPKWQFNAGIKKQWNEQLTLSGEINYLLQGKYTEMIGGVLASYALNQKGFDGGSSLSGAAIGGGLYLRWNDAIIPYAQVSYNHIDVGISYDVNISALKVASQGRGGFEFSLTYKGFTGAIGSGIKSMRCPRF